MSNTAPHPILGNDLICILDVERIMMDGKMSVGDVFNMMQSGVLVSNLEYYMFKQKQEVMKDLINKKK